MSVAKNLEEIYQTLKAKAVADEAEIYIKNMTYNLLNNLLEENRFNERELNEAFRLELESIRTNFKNQKM